MNTHILRNRSAFADGIDWCEDNLQPNTWRYNIEWRNNNPFDPTVVFDFDRPRDCTVFALKFT